MDGWKQCGSKCYWWRSRKDPFAFTPQFDINMCISGLIDHSTVIKRLLLKLSHLFWFYFVLDISIAAVDLMQELTDVDTLNESEEGASALIGALVRINYTIYQIYNPTFYANFSKSSLNLLEQIQTLNLLEQIQTLNLLEQIQTSTFY